MHSLSYTLAFSPIFLRRVVVYYHQKAKSKENCCTHSSQNANKMTFPLSLPLAISLCQCHYIKHNSLIIEVVENLQVYFLNAHYEYAAIKNCLSTSEADKPK